MPNIAGGGYLQGTSAGGATANGNGTPGETSGVDQAIQVEVVESAGGTCTVTLEGAFDGSSTGNWYAVGYQRVDGQASLTRVASGISVTANLKAVYQVLDPYPLLRARVSSVAGGATVTVRAYTI